MSGPGASAVLVVEDNGTIRDVVCELLRDEGYDIFEAEDGAAAISALTEHRPSPDSLCLVILDMLLPEADGVQVLKALSDLGQFVPVVAMSADHAQLVRAELAGAEATLEKPFNLDQLLSIVERNCQS